LIKIKINPEYGKLVPELSKTEYQELKQSIKQNGLWHPITVTKNGYVLDGHHRFKACKELGMEPKIEYKSLNNKLSEKLFVIDSNLNRRQLTEFARIKLALTRKPILEEIAKRNMSLGGKGVPIQTPLGRIDQRIAESANSTRNKVRQVEFLLDNAKSEVLHRLMQGKAKISKESLRIQKAIKIEKARQEAIAYNANSSSNNSRFELLLGDMRKLGKNIPDESIDLIFTDPPYAEEFLYLYDELAKLAQRVLKPGASLFTIIGNYALPNIIYRIQNNSSLKYHWEFAIKHNGHIARMWKHRIWPNWKPILWYFKVGNGNKTPTMFQDTNDWIESEPPQKIAHEWEQSTVEAAHVIRFLTREGMTVLDPFMGSGTTGKATRQLNRKFIGIEIDEIYFMVAQAQLS
jgi:DNA modification methylase/ParB-like chromosome segregation protein Spo0J